MENALATHGRWLSLPKDQPILSRILTRYLPWETLLEELEATARFSGYLEVANGLQSGRIFWLHGARRAVLMQERSARATITDLWWQVEISDLTSVSSDVEVSVYTLEPRVAQLALECSFSDARVLEPSMSATYSRLSQQNFSGVVFALGSGRGGSAGQGRANKSSLFWWQGQIIERCGATDQDLGEIKILEVYPSSGVLETPAPSGAAGSDSLPSASAIPGSSEADSGHSGEGQSDPHDAPQLVAFFNSALALSGPAGVLETAWRAAALDLSPDHPCLDPFADEIRIEGNRLELLADVPFDELQPALLEAYRLTLANSDIRLGLLPLDTLRQQQRQMWLLSGLGSAPELSGLS